MGSSPVRLAGEVVSARQEVLQVQEVAAKKSRNQHRHKLQNFKADIGTVFWLASTYGEEWLSMAKLSYERS